MRILSARTLVAASALLGLLTILRLSDPLPQGLTATFFPDADWSATPAATFIDPLPGTESFPRALGQNLPETFSATWVGTLAVLKNGTHTFAVDSDDASLLYVDDVLVVDNSGHHSTLRATGTIGLSRGPHRVLLKYAQYGGRARLAVWMAAPAGALKPIPSALLFPRRAEYYRLYASVALRRALPVVAWSWIAIALVAAAAAGAPAIARGMRAARSTPAARTLLAIGCASLALNVIGVWWGVPSAWAGDEIAPMTVLNALNHRFSGGWFDRYPPFHMHVLALAYSPWLLLTRTGLVHVSDVTDYGVLLVVGRLVSVVAAAGSVAVLYLVGRDMFGTRAGLLSAAALAVLTPFLYYAKTSNPEVPYVFWFSVSMLFYLRALRSARLGDFLGFAAAAILSICTKDQAYGLYLLTPIPLGHRLWEEHRDAGDQRPLARAVCDRRLWGALAAAVILFGIVHNILLNPDGFVTHVRDITGAGQQGYQMVDATVAGRLSLVRLAADLNQRSWGWPFSALALAGFVMAAADRRTRRATVALALVAVSYHVGFLNVVRYAFDRYLLPICVIEALFIGAALDRALDAPGRWAAIGARALTIAAFAYTLLYAAMVDVLMVRDSRYAAERWLNAHLDPSGIVGIMFPATVLPRLRNFQVAEIDTIQDLKEAQPAFFVLNADYARAVPATQPEARLAAGLQHEALSYRLAYRSSRSIPWAWLPWGHPNLIGPRDEVPVKSVLTQLSPTIEIYARDAGHDVR